MIVIFYLSSLQFPVDENMELFEHADKVVHILIYFGLAYLVSRNFLEKDIFGVKQKIYVFLFVFLYGLSDEIHQLFVPTRFFDLYDLLADVVGAGISLVFSKKIFVIEEKIFFRLSL
jgi:VanZ family protein